MCSAFKILKGLVNLVLMSELLWNCFCKVIGIRGFKIPEYYIKYWLIFCVCVSVYLCVCVCVCVCLCVCVRVRVATTLQWTKQILRAISLSWDPVQACCPKNKLPNQNDAQTPRISRKGVKLSCLRRGPEFSHSDLQTSFKARGETASFNRWAASHFEWCRWRIVIRDGG